MLFVTVRAGTAYTGTFSRRRYVFWCVALRTVNSPHYSCIVWFKCSERIVTCTAATASFPGLDIKRVAVVESVSNILQATVRAVSSVSKFSNVAQTVYVCDNSPLF